jgi:Glycosyl transferase family 2
MSRARRLVPQPLHQIVAETRHRWLAQGADPQFRLDGPFARGFWELRFRGAAPVRSQFDAVRVYYAADGQFTEAASVRFAGLGDRETEHTLSFWLPMDAQWLRFDPTESAGPVTLAPIDATRRSPGAAVLRGAIERLRRAPGRALNDFQRILTAARRDRRERNRLLVALALPEAEDGYQEWLARRQNSRRIEYQTESGNGDGLFSLITTVFDTPEGYLQVLATSVFDQTCRDFEWVILDNGSRQGATRAALARLAGDPRVRLFRVEDNLGIIGGMRSVLERAANRYVLPVDSDDYLFPDALSTIAAVVIQSGYPALLYSDEDKLRDRGHTDPFFKPDWDPVLLRNCCYIAHLCAIDREHALRLDVYSDREAEGCHDWDTFLRFVRDGRAAVHVPEILYSWRMHAASTAADAGSKAYIVSSHRHVLERHVELTGLSDRVAVVPSPFFPASPDWWFRRKRVNGPPVTLVIWAPADGEPPETVLSHLGGYPVARILIAGRDNVHSNSLAAIRAQLPGAGVEHLEVAAGRALDRAAQSECALVALADTRVSIVGDEWLWELAGLMEAFPEAAMVGGRLVDPGGRVTSAAAVFGLGESIDSPDRGRAAHDAGYFGTALKQRCTDVVSGTLCGFDPGFLRVARVDACTTPDEAAVTVALEAIGRHKRVIFSPFIEGRVSWSRCEWPRLIQYSSIAPANRYYHPLLSREPDTLFRPRT